MFQLFSVLLERRPDGIVLKKRAIQAGGTTGVKNKMSQTVVRTKEIETDGGQHVSCQTYQLPLLDLNSLLEPQK
jgi:hypothetical protein